jgi:hypothetical protein
MSNENQTNPQINPLRQRFLDQTMFFEAQTFIRTYLVIAVKLPTGAIELITNTDQLASKIEYYTKAYDDNFCLKNNPSIQIVGYMLV